MINIATLSTTLGWLYFFFWGISGYPALILNQRLRSVEGISPDFLFLNCWGYMSYLISTMMLFFSITVRNQYALRWSQSQNSHGVYDAAKGTPLIRVNDLAYVVHGALLTFTMLAQTYCFRYQCSSGSYCRRLSLPVRLILTAAVLVSLGSVVVALSMDHYGPHPPTWQWLDVAIINGYVKVAMSTCKYVPQLLWNHRRQSTQGWSMMSMSLDIAGGVCSLMQLALDAYLAGDLGLVRSNISKLILGILTVVFDFVFLLQYYTYRKRGIVKHDLLKAGLDYKE